MAIIDTYRATRWAIEHTISVTWSAIRLSWRALKAINRGLAVFIELTISLVAYIAILTSPIFVLLFPIGDPWLEQYEPYPLLMGIKLVAFSFFALVSGMLINAMFFKDRSLDSELHIPTTFERNLKKISKKLSILIISALFLIPIAARLEVLGLVTFPLFSSIETEQPDTNGREIVEGDIEHPTTTQPPQGQTSQVSTPPHQTPTVPASVTSDPPHASVFQIISGLLLVLLFVVVVYLSARRAYD